MLIILIYITYIYTAIYQKYLVYNPFYHYFNFIIHSITVNYNKTIHFPNHFSNINIHA